MTIKFTAFNNYDLHCSYGVVLWEMLAREIPYKGMEGVAIAFQVAKGELKLEPPDSSPWFLKRLLQRKLCLTVLRKLCLPIYTRSAPNIRFEAE